MSAEDEIRVEVDVNGVQSLSVDVTQTAEAGAISFSRSGQTPERAAKFHFSFSTKQLPRYARCMCTHRFFIAPPSSNPRDSRHARPHHLATRRAARSIIACVRLPNRLVLTRNSLDHTHTTHTQHRGDGAATVASPLIADKEKAEQDAAKELIKKRKEFPASPPTPGSGPPAPPSPGTPSPSPPFPPHTPSGPGGSALQHWTDKLILVERNNDLDDPTCGGLFNPRGGRGEFLAHLHAISHDHQQQQQQQQQTQHLTDAAVASRCAGSVWSAHVNAVVGAAVSAGGGAFSGLAPPGQEKDEALTNISSAIVAALCHDFSALRLRLPVYTSHTVKAPSMRQQRKEAEAAAKAGGGQGQGSQGVIFNPKFNQSSYHAAQLIHTTIQGVPPP